MGQLENMELYKSTAEFFSTAIKTYFINTRGNTPIKVLDFGCGKGLLADNLIKLGFSAYGCDVSKIWSFESEIDNRYFVIEKSPYRLPFENETFDIVISTSVLEHVQNKEEVFKEIHRVLKIGGASMHLFPSKWYLPVEPHIIVPFANYLLPNCPHWWLQLWAFLGVRNEFQKNKNWKEVFLLNQKYCKEGLSYFTNKEYKDLSTKIFGNYESLMDFYIKNSHGGVSKLLRSFPFNYRPLRKIATIMAGEIRMQFILQRKLQIK